MTQIASSPRARQLSVSGHGAPRKLTHTDTDPILQGYSALAGVIPPAPVEATEAAAQADTVLAEDAGEDLLSAVWRTSSYLESIEWELDSAQGQLFLAVRKAAAAGVSQDVLCKAANMAPEELADALAGFAGPGLPLS